MTDLTMGSDKRARKLLGELVRGARHLNSVPADDVVLDDVEAEHVRMSGAMRALAAMEPPPVSRLLSRLGHKDPRVRWACRRTLLLVGQRAVLPLIADMRSADDPARAEAAECLGEIGDERAVEPLVMALTDENEHVRQSAAHALGDLRCLRASDALVAALGDHQPAVRREVMRALVRLLGEHDAVTHLLPLLNDPCSDIRIEAQQTIEPAAAVENLMTAFAEAEDTRPRYALAELLGHAGDARAVGLLVAALTSEDATFNMTVALALVEIGDSKGIDAVLDWCEQELEENRRACDAGEYEDGGFWDAYSVLEEVSTPRSQAMVLASAKGQYDAERYLAFDALKVIGDASCADALFDAFRSTERPERCQAALLLAQWGDGRAAEMLVEAARDAGCMEEDRIAAAYALSALGDDRAESLFRELASSTDTRTRENALAYLTLHESA